jgi:hypothetical protein
MAQDVMVESRRDRAELVADAGMGRVSFGSVLAGTLVAYGAFAVLVAIAAAVVKAMDVNTDLSTREWRQLGVGGGIAVALVLFLSYFYGGYVAGRMARRGGAMNGVMVFFVGLVIAVGVAGLANVFTDADSILRNLRSVGIPTSWNEWRDIGTVAGIGSLVAMFAGSLLGGVRGERWHGKLLARAFDPEVGAGVPVNPAVRHVSGSVVDDGTSVMSRRDTTLDEDAEERDERRVTTDAD